LLLKNSSQRVRPIICVCGPPSSSGITYSPTHGMKTSIAPATMPARESGTVIFQKAVHAVAPRSEAASSRRRSIFARFE
jgi:hypothetical protein